jgi:hypothetical protein
MTPIARARRVAGAAFVLLAVSSLQGRAADAAAPKTEDGRILVVAMREPESVPPAGWADEPLIYRE